MSKKCNSPGFFSVLVVFLGVFFRKFAKNRKNITVRESLLYANFLMDCRAKFWIFLGILGRNFGLARPKYRKSKLYFEAHVEKKIFFKQQTLYHFRGRNLEICEHSSFIIIEEIVF